MSQLQFVTAVLLNSAKQKIAKHYFLVKQLYEIGPLKHIAEWLRESDS